MQGRKSINLFSKVTVFFIKGRVILDLMNVRWVGLYSWESILGGKGCRGSSRVVAVFIK